jgi:hypothetical protein
MDLPRVDDMLFSRGSRIQEAKLRIQEAKFDEDWHPNRNGM